MLQEILDKYLEIFPEERNGLKLLAEQINNEDKLNDRKNFRGHIAGDGIVLSPDRSTLLMILHNVFKMWQQPGGHWDPDDADPLAVAKREVTEETGLEKFKVIEWLRGEPLVPIDICLDSVPANPAKPEPAHYHHTFAYVFPAQTTKLHHQPEEVSSAKWATFEEAVEPRGSHFPRIITKLQRLR